jgi:hypothetical protein
VIEAIETFERVPETYLKAVKTKKRTYGGSDSIRFEYLESILFF